MLTSKKYWHRICGPRRISVCVMLALALSGSGQSREGRDLFNECCAGKDQVSKNQTRLTVTSTLVKETYCSADNLRLTIRLTFTNPGDKPLIIDRNYFAILKTFISRDLESARQGRLDLESTNNVGMHFVRVNKSLPDPKLFVILDPNESYVTTVNDYIPVYDGNKKHVEFLKPGTYLHQSVVLMWGGPNKLGDELKEKWKQYGILWLEPLTTEPVSFRVDTSSRIDGCDDE